LISKTIDLFLRKRYNYTADQSRIKIRERKRSNTRDLYWFTIPQGLHPIFLANKQRINWLLL